MQYGAEDFLPYERIHKSKKLNGDRKTLDFNLVLRFGVYFFVSFLISRVKFINLMAPFGIALLIAVVCIEKEREIYASAFGCLMGYMTLYREKGLEYTIILASIITINYILKEKKKAIKLLWIFAAVFLELTLYKFVLTKMIFTASVFTAFLEVVCIFSVYYIIGKSIICLKEIKVKNLLSNEEIVSLSITLALVLSGTYGAKCFGVSVTNVLCLTIISILGYVKGSPYAAACGVAMGTIVGLVSNEMIVYIGVYGLCGLVSGVFKEGGKWISGAAFLTAFILIKLYSNIGDGFKLIEAGIGLGVFLCIPSKVYNRLEIELDYEKKQEGIRVNYTEKIKEALISKLEGFSEVLFGMSETLEKLADNEKLAMKNKSGFLVQNLADRVCANCTLNSICWKREGYYTYNAFMELIQNYQEKNPVVPKELEKKCLEKSLLMKHTEEIVNKFIINEMWRMKLNESRGMLAEQIGNMANSVNEVMEEFENNININVEYENRIRRVLTKKHIEFKEVFCITDKNERIIVKITAEACGGNQKCIKEILPLISEVTDKNMCIADDGCNIDNITKNCTICFEERPKYHVATYLNRVCKDGEKYNGDSCFHGKLKDGTYIAVISDGMGSGVQAGQESQAAVNIIEKFTKAGFNKISAINAVNSVMSIKFSEDEKFSTVDIDSIDLYSGDVEFMKVGAVQSFIKRNGNVEVVQSKTLPIGVLDKVDVDIIKRRTYNGDFIVMVSDGVLDYDINSSGNVEWLVEYLRNTTSNDPERIGEEIIEKAKALSDGKVKDDMTVIVQKVYELY